MDMKNEAKKKMLQELKKMSTDMMGGELKGKMANMKKVTVASDSEKGLEKGLDKAKDMIAGMPKMDALAHDEALDAGSDDVPTDMNADEDYDDAGDREDECSPEELQAKIKELQDKLDKLKK